MAARVAPGLRAWIAPALATAIALAAFGIRAAHPPRIGDDAYITFRYARNLARGQGFVYNMEEKVQGTTTPLYTLLMVPGVALFGPEGLPRYAAILNALFDGLGAFFVFFIARRLGGKLPTASAASLLFALSPVNVMYSIAGMETALFTCLLLSAVSLLVMRRVAFAAVHLSLAVLARPDGLIMAVFFWIAVAWTKEWRNKRILLPVKVFLAPLVIWLAFSGLYFGSFLPHSIAAKQLAYSSDSTIPHLALEFLRQGSLALTGIGSLPGFWQWLIPGLPLALFLIGAAEAFRSDPAGLTLGGFPIAYTLAISAGAPFLFQWYAAPPIPFWLIGCTLGLQYLLDKFVPAFAPAAGQTLFARVAPALLGLLLGSAIVYQFTRYNRPGLYLEPRWPDDNREEYYRETAIQLLDVIPPESTVALAEIGTFGWFHPARVLDAVGLVSPAALECYPLDRHYYHWNSAIPSLLIQREKPDYVVAFRGFIRKSLLESEHFKRAYRRIREFPYQLWESPGPWVYQRLPEAEIEANLMAARERMDAGQYPEAMQVLAAPLVYSWETRAKALAVLDADRLNRLATLSPWESRFASGIFRDFEPVESNGSAWEFLDRWGRVFSNYPGGVFYKDWNRVSLVNLDAEAVDMERDETPTGWLVLDNAGNLYRTEDNRPWPSWMLPEPGHEIPHSIDLEIMPDGKGLLILDAFGGIHPRGRVPWNKTELQKRRWEYPIAKDMEISPDGLHLYLLDGNGGIHHLGPAEGSIVPQKAHYWGWDIIRDIEFLPGENALLMLAGNGSLHLYSESDSEYNSKLPYPDWDYLKAIHFHPATGGLSALDSNGHLYENR